LIDDGSRAPICFSRSNAVGEIKNAVRDGVLGQHGAEDSEARDGPRPPVLSTFDALPFLRLGGAGQSESAARAALERSNHARALSTGGRRCGGDLWRGQHESERVAKQIASAQASALRDSLAARLAKASESGGRGEAAPPPVASAQTTSAQVRARNEVQRERMTPSDTARFVWHHLW
jgi:hypothetical protein